MALSEDTMSKHLSGYKSACEDHPDLKSFDSSLQQRTIKVIDKVTAGAETGNGFVSQHEIHMEVSQHLAEVSQDVANFILESEVDVWENIPLKSLVNAYFENTMKTLEIFDKITKCVENAELGQHFILEAVAQFDKEEKDVGGKKTKYEKTLKELKKFKAMGDPFNGLELNSLFKSIKEQQESLLKDVSEAKTELDKEVEKVAKDIDDNQKWRFWSNVFFGAAAFFAFVASVTLIASGFGAPAGIALAGVLFLGIVPGWIGVQVFLKKRLDALKKQQEALKKLNDKLESFKKDIKRDEEVDKNVLESISELVEGVEENILDLLRYVDDAIDNEGDEVDTKLALHSIRDKVKKLIEELKELRESVDAHKKSIRKARLHVLEKIKG